MPLPVGHTLAGLITGEFFPPKGRWQPLLAAVVVANLADLDFLPGLLLGEPNRFHHGLSHTLLAAAALWLLVRFLPPLRRHSPLPAAAVFWTYLGHLALDWVTVDLRAPFGMQLLWPLSSHWFLAGTPVFFNIERANHTAHFFPSLFCRHNLMAAGRELILIGGVWLAIRVVRKVRQRSVEGKA